MPDRAVVDVPSFGRTVRNARVQQGIYIKQAAEALGMPPAEFSSIERNDTPVAYEKALEWIAFLGLDPNDVPMPRMAPRALVALSEDRQWLVVHRYLDDQFCIMREFVYDYGYLAYKEVGWLEDTGQDAHQVLADWMAGQG